MKRMNAFLLTMVICLTISSFAFAGYDYKPYPLEASVQDQTGFWHDSVGFVYEGNNGNIRYYRTVDLPVWNIDGSSFKTTIPTILALKDYDFDYYDEEDVMGEYCDIQNDGPWGRARHYFAQETADLNWEQMPGNLLYKFWYKQANNAYGIIYLKCNSSS